jgi:DNA invertase Pin-like site-specific DNA recombinase
MEFSGMAASEFQDRCPNRLTVHILAAVAEHERAAISERTKAERKKTSQNGLERGMAGRRARTFKEGLATK